MALEPLWLPQGARHIVRLLAAQEIVRQLIHKGTTSKDVSIVDSIVCDFPGVCHKRLNFNVRGVKEECLLPLQAILHIKPTLSLVKKTLSANPDALYAVKPGSELSCLAIACLYGASLEVIQFLCQSDNTKSIICNRDINGSTALHLACRSGQSFSVIEFLVKTNPRALRTHDRGTWTPLEVAALCHKSPKVMSLFLDLVSEEEQYDATVLHVAAYANTAEVIKLLVDKFPWMLMRPHTETGFLPLHFACKRQDISITVLQVLIQQNRDSLTTMDRSGRLPLTLAHHCHPPSPMIDFLRQETVRVVE